MSERSPLRLLESLVDEHSARRRYDRTYDTARAVLLDLLHDFRLAMTGPISPDCRNAPFKCGACSGDAWDEEADAPAACACPCHTDRKDHA